MVYRLTLEMCNAVVNYKARQKYKIDGTICDDGLTGMLCWGCSQVRDVHTPPACVYSLSLDSDE